MSHNLRTTDTFKVASTVGAHRCNGGTEFDHVGRLTVEQYAAYLERAHRLAQAARLGVPVISVAVRDLDSAARLLGLPPTPPEAFERAFCGASPAPGRWRRRLMLAAFVVGIAIMILYSLFLVVVAGDPL